MICPILQLMENGEEIEARQLCRREDCAWWISAEERCSIKELALRNILPRNEKD